MKKLAEVEAFVAEDAKAEVEVAAKDVDVVANPTSPTTEMEINHWAHLEKRTNPGMIVANVEAPVEAEDIVAVDPDGVIVAVDLEDTVDDTALVVLEENIVDRDAITAGKTATAARKFTAAQVVITK